MNSPPDKINHTRPVIREKKRIGIDSHNIARPSVYNSSPQKTRDQVVRLFAIPYGNNLVTASCRPTESRSSKIVNGLVQ